MGESIEENLSQTLFTLEEWLKEHPKATSSATILKGIVRVNDPKWKKLEVYSEPLASSKIVGVINYRDLYFFSQKLGNWYRIEFKENQFGWVQSQFLEELP